MQSGIDFLRAQVDETIVQHSALVSSIHQHETDTDDSRYRDLCARHLPRMRDHQASLEHFRTALGSHASGSTIEIAGAIRKAAGSAFAIARSFADSPPQSDYERLAGDLDLARRLEVTFKTFRDAGRELRVESLAQLGELAERHHDDYSADAKRLLLQLFIERADGAAATIRTAADSRADFGMR